MNTSSTPGILIGLTGGIGSGKSTVARIIEEHYPVLYSDSIARDIMENDEKVRGDIVRLFGVQAYRSDASLDRLWLAEVVFNDDAKLAKLNSIVHPPTLERLNAEAETHFADGTRMVFVESAILFESGLESLFDYTLAVHVDPEIALHRIALRDGVGEETIRARMRRQFAPDETASLADFVIRNDASLDDLRLAVESILTILSSLRRRRS